MKFLLLIVAAAAVCVHFCTSDNCRAIPKHYEELNCSPVLLDEHNCTLSFDCSSFERRNKSKCHYKGREFDVGTELNSSEIEESCVAICMCRKDEDDEAAKFRCAHIDCPEFLGEELAENCIRQYRSGGCCAEKTVCGDDVKKLTKCEFGGKTYHEGQQIDVEGSCYSCLCGEGFENKPVEENKHCKKVDCQIDLHYAAKFYDGCTPIYYKKEDCCPIDFRCPQPETRIIPMSNKTRVADQVQPSQCKFGEHTLDIGDSLSSEYDGDCTTCTCKVPPHLTCIKTC